MASRRLLRPGAMHRAAGVAATMGATFFLSSSAALAEVDPVRRKPIYDEPQLPSPPPQKSSSSSSPPSLSESTSPTPTPSEASSEARLAGEVRRARLSLYNASKSAEDSINSLAARFFALEESFTQTIVSVAPPIHAPERQNNAYLPNLTAVFVAALGGSILAHRRNFLIRGTTPIALGIGAGWYFVPVTMRNLGDLIWSWEKRAPVVADTHLRVRDGSVKAWDMTVAHGKMSAQWVDDKVAQARKVVDGWISGGK